MSHCNYHRRASIDKFNNRPPFDIKKMDDATSTENKEQKASFCNYEKNCMNTATKSYISVAKYLEQFGDKCQLSVNNKNKNIIPKIIESFQKVGPKTMAKRIKSKKNSESLETLFRSDTQNFGTILPNHKIMKDLLKNIDDENSIDDHLSYQQIDMIPIKDTSINISRSVTGDNLTIRVDKGTSTTGLQSPVIQNSIEKRRISSSHPKYPAPNNLGKKIKSKIPQRKQLYSNNSCKFIDGKKSSGSSDLEYFPTKENPLKRTDLVSKIPLQISKMANKITMDKEFPLYKHNINQENFNKECTYILYTDKSSKYNGKIDNRKKEKSFVQLQVEKFNKKYANKNNHSRGFPSHNNLKAAKFQDKRKNMNEHYIYLMNSVRDTLPKMEGQSASDSENHEWYDNHVNSDHQVRFPKETRNAMEHLIKHFKRVPLTQYVKNQDLDVQPAISITSHAEYSNAAYTGMSHKKLSRNSYQRSCHDDERFETVPPLRYAKNNRLRINQRGS